MHADDDAGNELLQPPTGRYIQVDLYLVKLLWTMPSLLQTR